MKDHESLIRHAIDEMVARWLPLVGAFVDKHKDHLQDATRHEFIGGCDWLVCQRCADVVPLHVTGCDGCQQPLFTVR